MLSILLPTHNYNITKLVADLHQQALNQYVDFEIIVMEDGSTLFKDENKTVSDLKFCQYIVLPQNIGRSAIRNRLADTAKYDHLLFIDCDAEVFSENYIEKYVTFCKEDCVVIGGTAYETTETNANYSLRLKYGREREARTAAERSKNNFSTFNFLISKSIFNRVRFDESIRGYGHEDMLFGHQLHQLGYEFIQIENPLIHKGLDDNETFLYKTDEGTRNLFRLYKTGRYPFLADESKLLNTYIKIHKTGLTRLLALKYDLLKSLLRRQLCSRSPSLLVYDLYKILFLCKTSLFE
ncbi:MAG: glycosyltransferase [Paludibacter sp.]|nr:glycosyltransferase [Paludibacter sp.]